MLKSDVGDKQVISGRKTAVPTFQDVLDFVNMEEDNERDKPFKVEYAKSGRAACKSCKDAIDKDKLRLAIMVQSPHFDGQVPNWFHYECFWKRARVSSADEIGGLACIRWDDQKKIKDHIAASGGNNAGAGDKGSSSDVKYKDFTTEYAKTNKSTCRGCETNIDKNLVRIAVKDYDSQRAKMYGPQNRWYHVNCFNEKREELEFTANMDPTKITGFAQLAKEDKDMVLEVLGKGEATTTTSKKRKAPKSEDKPKQAKIVETEEDKLLREQADLVWKTRDILSRDVSKDGLRGLLEYNRQSVPSGESKLLDCVSDCMTFGALEPCPECKGQLVWGSEAYHCTGNITEWTKCQYKTQKPKRKPFKVPKEYHDVPFLQNFKFVSRERVFASKIDASLNTLGNGNIDQPLKGLKFVLLGKTSKSQADLTNNIVSLGGEVAKKVDKTTAACISSKKDVEKMSKQMQAVKEVDVHVVDETFLDDVKTGNIADVIKQHAISSWGSDPAKRIGKDSIDGSVKSTKSTVKKSLKEETHFTKSVPATMKLKVKDGAAVDPDSGLEDKAHVYREGTTIFNVILGMVDISRGTNSYYKLQMLESDGSNRYWIFRAWGRVGTTIGGNKVDSFGSKALAKEEFERLYLEKTGNLWEDRDNFTKQAGKFYPLDVVYDVDDNVPNLSLNSGSGSKLPKPVQDLVKMIFNVESMKKALLEFEIDLKKMPLGKLSKKQIQTAFSVLNEAQTLQTKGGTTTQLLDVSNRFYTLIPHDFGMKKPPLLDNADIIKSKSEMLDNLLEIEVAYSLLKDDGTSSTKDPIDSHYERLKTKLVPMDKSSETFQRLSDYVQNTHAATHRMYDLEVAEIFTVEREGEFDKYKQFKSLHNRKLLWHGSRTTNFAGILSQGLRIAPPEAPVTGYMFGKGIYFADMSSKSANYCFTSRSDPTGLMLLCEVALGNMHELTGASYIQQLPSGKHSTKGCGMTIPSPDGTYINEDGVEIPMGKSTASNISRSSLLYNEYIVYDVSQVNIKYLLKLNFKYK